jgi:predicted DNA-binding protein
MRDKEYTVTMPHEASERLDALCKITEGTHAEVIANALRLYETMIQEVESGSVFMVKKPDGRMNTYMVI